MWRLIVAVILFLLSLLTVFKAPTNFFWRVAVAVTEFPYIPVAVTLILFFLFYKTTVFRISTIITMAAALVLFSLPIIQAMLMNKAVKGEIAQVFAHRAFLKEHEAFTFSKMFTGKDHEEVEPKVFAYKKLPERDLNIDFYSATSVEERPCVVVIHGGSWAAGDSKQLPDLNSYIVMNTGCHVAAINYRLAPQYHFPSQIEDIKDALDELTKKSEELKINTNRFILLGRSAGGQMALLYAYRDHDPRIKGVISFYGPADMAWGATIKTNKWVIDVDKVFKDYLGGLITEIPETYKRSTACNFVDKDSPRTLLIHGPNDALVSYHHSERLEEKLKQNNVPYYFLKLPWATHGCDYNINGPSGQLSSYAVAEFIRAIRYN